MAANNPFDCLSDDYQKRLDDKAARDAIIAAVGKPGILVNAAGGNRPDATLPPGSDFCKLPKDAWQNVFDLNLVGGVLLPAQVFGETMVADEQGSIINIASMAGRRPFGGAGAYHASSMSHHA